MSSADEFSSLDTTSLNQYFPGIKAQIGPDVPVQIQYKIKELGNFKSKDGEDPMSLDAQVSL